MSKVIQGFLEERHPHVYIRKSKSGHGILVNLPEHYLYIDIESLKQLLENRVVYIRGTVYRKEVKLQK